MSSALDRELNEAIVTLTSATITKSSWQFDHCQIGGPADFY